MVLLLFIHCSLLPPLFVGFCVWSLCCNVVLSVFLGLQSFGKRERELVFLLLYGCWCSVPYLTVPWVGLQCVNGALLIILNYVFQFKPLYLILILIAYASDKGSGYHAHFQSLVNVFTACRHKVVM